MTLKIFDNFPIIEIDEYILSEIKEHHAVDFYKYITHEKISSYLADSDLPSSLSNAKEELMYWANLYKYRSSIYWAIITKSNDLIGTIGFNSWNQGQKRVELSYDLSYDYWGKGIMAKSVKAVCNFAFIEMNIRRIQATVVTDNARSIKLLENLSFKREGILKNYANLKNIQKDSYMYALTL